MIHLRYDEADLARLRIVFSPYWDVLCGVIASARARPDAGPLRRRQLLDAARGVASLPSVPFLRDGILPDFLSPIPEAPGETFAQAVDRILAMPGERVEAELEAYSVLVPQRREAVLRAWARPRVELERLTRALSELWQGAFSEEWSLMAGLHQGELVRLGLLLATKGAQPVLDELRPAAMVRDGEVLFPRSVDMALDSRGRGITIVASVFAPSRAFVGAQACGPAIIIRPPAGRSLLWSDMAPEAGDPVVELIGPARAAILRLLDTPRATADIGRLLSAAPNTTSYHLARLREAGLLRSVRAGRRVYYGLTDRGTQFLALWRRNDAPALAELVAEREAVELSARLA